MPQGQKSQKSQKSQKGQVLARLKAQLAVLERRPEVCAAHAGRPGPPWGALAQGALNEIWSRDPRHMASAHGFALALAGDLVMRHGGAVVWIQQDRDASEGGALYPLGLSAFGLSPERFVVVRPATVQTLLWAAEEAVKCAGTAALLIDCPRPHRLLSITATRRLQLAANVTGAAAILLRCGEAAASSAWRRWHVTPMPSVQDPYDMKAPGSVAWQVELTRCRSGGRGRWIVEWQHETRALVERRPHPGNLAAPLADGPAEALKAAS